MGRVTWRGVAEHPVRFAMSVLAVVLGIAFVTGTFSLRAVLSGTFNDIVNSSLAADVYVRGQVVGTDDSASSEQGNDVGETRAQIPITLADSLAELPGVSVALPSVTGTAVLVGADGTAVGVNGAPAFGVELDPDDPTVHLSSGRFPEKQREIAVEQSSLERSGLAVGDTTTVVAGDGPFEVTIVGSATVDTAVSGAVLIGFDPTTARSLFAADGLVSSIGVYGDGSESMDALEASVQTAMAGQDVEIVSGDELRSQARDTVNEMIGFVGAFLMVFAVVALAVGSIIIANTFAMSVRSRLREIAVLRAVGASPRQVFNSVVGQAAIVGAVGSVLGIPLGMGLVHLIGAVLSSMGIDMAIEVPLTVSTVAIALGCGIGVSLLAAAVPAWNAAHVPPVAAMAQSGGATDKPLGVRTVIGVVVLAIGGGLLTGAALGTWHRTALLAWGAAVVLAGALLVAPGIIGPFARALTWPFEYIGRPLVSLARGNVARNARRSATTAGALMIGMALVGAAATLAASTEKSVAGIVEDTVQTDMILQSPLGTIPADALAAASDASGVARVDAVGLSTAQLDDSPGVLMTAPDGVIGTEITVETVAGDVAAANASGEALVTEALADERGWQVGDQITVTSLAPGADGASATVTVQIGAVISSTVLATGVVVPEDLYNQVIPEQMNTVPTALITVAPGTSLADAHAAVADAVAPFYVVSVFDKAEFTSTLTSQVREVLAILYALLGLSVVIAVLGIVNTLALSVLERTREIGLERAVGLSRGQLGVVTVVESVIISVTGTLLGLVIGLAIASVLPSVYADSGLSELAIPAAQLAGMVGLSVVVGIVAALWPAARAARMPVLESIAAA